MAYKRIAHCKSCHAELTFHVRLPQVAGGLIYTHPPGVCAASGKIVGALGLVEVLVPELKHGKV